MIGRTVGGYEVTEQIGEGGMGIVYLAKHTLMNKRAVLKVVRSHLATDEKIAARFINEANAAASIRHPGIADVMDVGRTDDGTLYILMEHLEGESLGARMRRGPMPRARLLSITRQVASVLGAAHEAGVVHRDLKPDNIFLVPDAEAPGGERAKLLDFGIAKLAPGLNTAELAATRDGTMMGTPVYMSPEQCRGIADIDGRADLYALGCIVFEALTGKPPFVHQNFGDLISAHINDAPPAAGTLDPAVGHELEEVVNTLLSKAPDDRYHSASHLIAAIDGVASEAGDTAAFEDTVAPDSEAASVGPATTLSGAAAEVTPASPGRRSWLGAGLAAGLLATAVAGFAIYSAVSGAEGDEAPETTRQTSTTPAIDAAALEPPRLARRALANYRDPKGSAISDLNSSTWWKSVKRDYERAAQQPGAPVRWKAGVSLADGFIAALDGRPQDAVAAYRRAVELDETWPEAHAALAVGLSKIDEDEAAIAAASEAQRLDPDWLGAAATAARVLVHAGRNDEAIQEFRRALNRAPENPVLLAELALVYHAARLDTQALRYAKHALSIDGDMAPAHLLLAERALEKNDGKTAIEHAERTAGRLPRSLPARLAVADALVLLGRKEEARAAYEELVRLHAEKMIDDSARMANRYDRVKDALSKNRLPRPRARSRRPQRSVKCDPNDPLCGL